MTDIINPEAGWPDVPLLSTRDLVKGGIDGPSNAQAIALAARTKALKNAENIELNTAEHGTLPLSEWVKSVEDYGESVFRTSISGGLNAAIDKALSAGGKVVVDSVCDLSSPIVKNLNGRDLTITREGGGVINWVGTQSESAYRVMLTLNGTGVERVVTATKINGNKVRGVGAPIIGFVINNVNEHYEGCEVENLSAVCNTVKANLHVCTGARYKNIVQQLPSQEFMPGVYGYGTVPLDCENIYIFGNQFGVVGAPIDRHPVYVSSHLDGTGYSRNAHVFNNTCEMRYYVGETPVTGHEDCFKFIGTKNINVNNNVVNGGVSMVILGLRTGQVIERVVIENNVGRHYSRFIKVLEEVGSSSAEYIRKLISKGNTATLTTEAAGQGIGYLLERVLDIDLDDTIESASTSVFAGQVISLMPAAPNRCQRLSARLRYSRFNHVFYGDAAVSHNIDAVGTEVPNTRIENRTSQPTSGRTRLDPLNGANIKNNPSFDMNGQEYFDYPHLRKWIRCIGANNWVDGNGVRVVGAQADRPVDAPIGHVFYQTQPSVAIIVWTGSKWVNQSAWTGSVIKAGDTAQINAVNKALLGYGHSIYNTETRKPVFFDEFAQSWKYADGSVL